MRADFELLQGRTMEQFEHQLRQQDDTLSAQLRELEKSLLGDYRILQESTQENQAEMQSIIDATRSDVTLWQTDVLQRLKGAEKEVDSDIAGFKMQVNTTIAAVQDDFSRQRDDLINRTEQERKELQDQMTRLFSQANELDQHLAQQTESAMQSFAAKYEEFNSVFQRNMKEREQQIETRMREFRSLVQETREQFSAMENKLVGKLEDRANLLGLNVAEIEKRQKAFLDQTKLFERADTLKIALQQSIDEIKNDMQRIENQRKELREMENQFQRLRKLGDEALDKMGKFTQEKRRIDQLEQDYKELMRLTQAVDSQIQSMDDSNDFLQAMQLQLRGIEELQASVEEKYQKIQSRQDILAGTTRGIDENFKRLNDLEDVLGELQQQIQAVPSKVDGLSEMLNGLQKERGSVEHAVSQLGSLNTVLTDVEQRIEHMQKAREWLARTETRFEELNRQADDQLQVMRAVLQDSGKGKGSAKEAPSVQAREMVIKLSRNGWKIDEIAKTTKLSPGEVELILEIAHK